MERNRCADCLLFKQASSWIGTPFKLRDYVRGRGADCVSAPASVWVEVGLLSKEKFLEFYNVRMLGLFRRDQQEFLHQLRILLGPDYKVDTSDKTVNCGDIVIRVIGRYREMFTALFVSNRFLVARPASGVLWLQSFEFDYKVSKTDFRCPYDTVQ